MTRSIQRVGDVNSGGGVITNTPQSTVTIAGIPIALTGSTGTGHGTGIHAAGAWQCVGTSNITINGINVIITGDIDTCGHVRLDGGSKVTID